MSRDQELYIQKISNLKVCLAYLIIVYENIYSVNNTIIHNPEERLDPLKLPPFCFNLFCHLSGNFIIQPC